MAISCHAATMAARPGAAVSGLIAGNQNVSEGHRRGGGTRGIAAKDPAAGAAQTSAVARVVMPDGRRVLYGEGSTFEEKTASETALARGTAAATSAVARYL